MESVISFAIQQTGSGNLILNHGQNEDIIIKGIKIVSIYNPFVNEEKLCFIDNFNNEKQIYLPNCVVPRKGNAGGAYLNYRLAIIESIKINLTKNTKIFFKGIKKHECLNIDFIYMLGIRDFYYSKKAHEICIKMYGDKCKLPRINGMEYTECVNIGLEPMTKHFGDLVKVFQGEFTGYKAKYN